MSGVSRVRGGCTGNDPDTRGTVSGSLRVGGAHTRDLSDIRAREEAGREVMSVGPVGVSVGPVQARAGGGVGPGRRDSPGRGMHRPGRFRPEPRPDS
ncbi:hypothetical protein GCM10027408_10140 [Microbacterium tumbae]